MKYIYVSSQKTETKLVFPYLDPSLNNIGALLRGGNFPFVGIGNLNDTKR